MQSSEVQDWTVPERMVGLIIGKGGESIANIYAKSGCKIQFAPDSAGMADRPCTLSGTPEGIIKAKELVAEIIQSAHDNFPGLANDSTVGNDVIELYIPGNKVGLIIGKAGETIRTLQVRAEVKMVLIQETNQPTAHEKLLRIIGESQKCQLAKDMVMDLIAGKPDDMGLTRPSMPGYGGPEHRFPVPTERCGLVIGKGGETIRNIKATSGAHVELSRLPESDPSEKIFKIQGTQEQVQRAIQLVCEKAGLPVPPMNGMPGPGPAVPNQYNNHYNAYGGQYGATVGAPQAAAQQQYMSPQQWGGVNVSQQQNQAVTNPTEATVNPQTGQMDYSAAWAEYYWQQGMYDHANAMLAQAQQNQGQR